MAGTLLALLIGLLLSLFGVVEGFIRSILVQADIPVNLQQITMLLMSVLLIVGIVRVFGGILRFMLVLFLILLVLHILVPTLATVQP